MELYLVRHAIAEDREDFAKTNKDDSLRPLTPKGRKKMQKVALGLRELIGGADLIVSSPFVRARQTAEILSQFFFDTKVVEAAELVPQSPPAAFLRWLKAHGRESHALMAVGHEPQLSVFASYLLTGQGEPVLSLKKSGVLCLEVESFDELAPGSAELKWLVPPKIWEGI